MSIFQIFKILYNIGCDEYSANERTPDALPPTTQKLNITPQLAISL
jgi:hypothetical protein